MKSYLLHFVMKECTLKYLPNLVGFVEQLSQSNMSYTQIVMHMAITSGYSIPVARRIVEAVLDYGGNAHELHVEPSTVRPDIDTTSNRFHLHLGDAQPTIMFEQMAPRIVVLDGFLSEQECDEICSESSAGFFPSKVMVEEADYVRDSAVRSSSTATLKRGGSPLITRIETRIERLLNWPTARGEDMQVQRYGKGEQYLPHFDFFSGGMASHDKVLARGGQRLATLIMYLRQPEAGGATHFANLGARVMPLKGTALFFSYPEASESSGTLHCGEPVQEGEKWIMTKWLRERDCPNTL